MRKSKGYNAKTRALFRKKPREKGKLGLSRILYEYKVGEKVLVKIDSGFHKGMPHRRYHGNVGVITALKGRAYVVSVKQGKATKEIIIRPEHLSPIKG